MRKAYYWDKASEAIGKLLKNNMSSDMSIFEIGFSGGHFLEWLYDNGYRNLHGIEIRTKQYLETKENFRKKGLDCIELLNGDVLEHDIRYDAAYCTGLIQCLDITKRKVFLNHVSKLSNLVVYTVPRIDVARNLNSNVSVAVSGCPEYPTGNIPYELSQLYESVRVGMISKSKTGLDDDFIYYICKKSLQIV